MKIVNAKQITGTAHDVNWGNGTSRRMIVEADGMGYSVHYTVTFRGTSSKLKYDNHLESCYDLYFDHGLVKFPKGFKVFDEEKGCWQERFSIESDCFEFDNPLPKQLNNFFVLNI